jgi:hypothetical protein
MPAPTLGFPMPLVKARSADGGHNQPTGDPKDTLIKKAFTTKKPYLDEFSKNFSDPSVTKKDLTKSFFIVI